MSVQQAVNRKLLREAGEHLGTLAEEAKVRCEMHERTTIWSNSIFAREAYQEYAKLSRLSKDVLEIAK